MATADPVLRDGRVLVVDGDPAFRRSIARILGHHLAPGTLREADCIEAAEREFDDAAAVIVTLGTDRGETARLLATAGRMGPVIAIGDCGSLSLAVTAMRAGAVDFLAKPVGAAALVDALERAVETGAATAPAPAQAGGFEGFIGRSSAIRGVFDQIARIAASRAPVLVTGESGTGKELCAEAVHARSRRRGAFVPVNCGAIPRDLMESELFGHQRGAFTGAHEDRAGAAELADGGTLFLDEIGELEPALQTKLLRFVQTGMLTRVGASQPRPVDVRIVCATNRDPVAEVNAGRFREDLFYRVNVLPIHLPPLRARRDDILPLAQTFLAQFADEEGRAFAAFEAEARALLVNYDWPGNVRQLQNVIRRVVVMNDAPKVAAEMLAIALAHAGWQGAPAARERRGDAPSLPSARGIEPFWQQERRIIEEALAAFDGNVGRAAAALEISPSTIYRKKQTWDAQMPAA